MRELCGEDCALQEEVESLLAADADKASILDHDPDRDLRGRVFDAVASALEDATCVLAPGDRLGAYEISGFLGRGGMGEVYRARDTKLNRDVALKILPSAFATDSDRLGRFRREAQVLASLNHPNIGHIYGLEDGVTPHALVLELVDGDDLSEIIARHSRSAPAAAGPSESRRGRRGGGPPSRQALRRAGRSLAKARPRGIEKLH